MQEKDYGNVECVHFNRKGEGPFIEDLYVRANVHPSDAYPQARIFVGATVNSQEPRDFGGICLTVKDAKALREKLGRAIADVTKACPKIVLEDLEDVV